MTWDEGVHLKDGSVSVSAFALMIKYKQSKVEREYTDFGACDHGCSLWASRKDTRAVRKLSCGGGRGEKTFDVIIEE